MNRMNRRRKLWSGPDFVCNTTGGGRRRGGVGERIRLPVTDNQLTNNEVVVC